MTFCALFNLSVLPCSSAESEFVDSVAILTLGIASGNKIYKITSDFLYTTREVLNSKFGYLSIPISCSPLNKLNKNLQVEPE